MIKTLTFHVPTGNEGTENEAWLKELMIDQLHELGFDFEKYAHVMDEDDEQGTHILKFKENGSKDANITDETRRGDWEAMVQICTQDDDSQPCATFRFHFGTLWVYIPYSA